MSKIINFELPKYIGLVNENSVRTLTTHQENFLAVQSNQLSFQHWSSNWLLHHFPKQWKPKTNIPKKCKKIYNTQLKKKNSHQRSRHMHLFNIFSFKVVLGVSTRPKSFGVRFLLRIFPVHIRATSMTSPVIKESLKKKYHN